jgi:hypothetical protein
MQHSKVTFLTNEGVPVEASVQGPLLVARGERARFLVRLKCLAFRPQSMVIDEAPDEWKVYDFNIHGHSQFTRTGDDEKDAIPGDMFRAGNGGPPLGLQTVQTAMNLWIDVMYTGPRPDAPFVCSVRGLAAL